MIKTQTHTQLVIDGWKAACRAVRRGLNHSEKLIKKANIKIYNPVRGEGEQKHQSFTSYSTIYRN